MVEICNCGLIPVVPVQEGRSALSKRSSIDMGQHARAAAAARLVPGGAASLPVPMTPSDSAAQVKVCGPAGCFPARPAPLSIPECAPCSVFAGGAAATAVAADCTSSGATAAASASASAALPSFTPHGVLHRSSDGGTVVVAAGSSPHLPRVRSRPSLAGGGNGKAGDFAGCFDFDGGGGGGGGARPLGDSSFLSPGGDKNKTWLQQQQQHEQNREDEMMDAAAQADAAAAAAMSSPPPSLVSVAAGGGGNGGGGGRG